MLENVEGIDGIIMGHSHGKIADKIDGVPVTMAGSWGLSLGLIHFHLLNRDAGEWEVFSSCAVVACRRKKSRLLGDG